MRISIRSIHENWGVRILSIYSLLSLATAPQTSAQNFWQATSGPYGGVVQAFAINQNEEIFAGTDNGGIFYSENHGEAWTERNNGITNKRVRSLAINSRGDIFAGTDGGEIFRSTDNGASWKQLTSGTGMQGIVALAINSRNHIFAGAYGSYMPFRPFLARSTDNGETWEGLPVLPYYQTTDFHTLAINDSDHVFAGAEGGLYRSKDNGVSWEPLTSGLTAFSFLALVINPATQVIFAGTDKGIFRSADNGNNWRQINSGLTSTTINALAIDPVTQNVFAGTLSGGVFCSTNNGESWTAINDGLTHQQIWSLTIDSSGHLLAGTNGGGVFRSLRPTTGVQERANPLPRSFKLRQNFPNPFSHETRISFTLPSSEFVIVKVYDLLGKEIATLLSQRLAAGDHELKWSIDPRLSLPAGVYFYRLQTRALMDTKKVVMIKAVR